MNFFYELILNPKLEYLLVSDLMLRRPETSATNYVAVKNFYFTIFLDAFDPSVYVMVRMQMPFAGALSLRPERS